MEISNYLRGTTPAKSHVFFSGITGSQLRVSSQKALNDVLWLDSKRTRFDEELAKKISSGINNLYDTTKKFLSTTVKDNSDKSIVLELNQNISGTICVLKHDLKRTPKEWKNSVVDFQKKLEVIKKHIDKVIYGDKMSLTADNFLFSTEVPRNISRKFKFFKYHRPDTNKQNDVSVINQIFVKSKEPELKFMAPEKSIYSRMTALASTKKVLRGMFNDPIFNKTVQIRPIGYFEKRADEFTKTGLNEKAQHMYTMELSSLKNTLVAMDRQIQSFKELNKYPERAIKWSGIQDVVRNYSGPNRQAEVIFKIADVLQKLGDVSPAKSQKVLYKKSEKILTGLSFMDNYTIDSKLKTVIKKEIELESDSLNGLKGICHEDTVKNMRQLSGLFMEV